MIGKSMRVMQTFIIASVTHHQQCFSMRNTKVNSRNNAAPIMQSMIDSRMSPDLLRGTGYVDWWRSRR
jgi:hypothetical protein